LGYAGWVDDQAHTGQDPVAAVTVVGSVQVIRLRGRLSAAHAPAVDDSIKAVARDATAVVVDLSAVLLIDAAIARTLRTSIARQVQRGNRVGVAGAHGQPLEVLEVLGIAKEVGAYRDLAEAIEEARTETDDPRASIEMLVHGLLATAGSLAPSDPRRATLENEAIEAALPLARTLAHRYTQRGESMDDLVQVASLGVVRAVQGYDPDHGSGFRAYAVPTILGELKRYFRDHAWVVRPPRRLQELHIMTASIRPRLAQELGHDPTCAELAARLGVDPGDVERAAGAADGLCPASLDAPMTIGDSWTMHEIVGDDDPAMEIAESRWVLTDAIAALPAGERELLKMRFGDELTQSEIAARLGTSQMSVSRSLASTVRKLRRALLAQD